MAESIFDELSRGLEEVRLSNLELELVQGENRLRLLARSSIPIAEARLISLEKALEAEPQTFEAARLSNENGVTENAPVLNPVYLQLRQSLADTSIEVDALKREAEALADRVSFLSTESDLLRKKLSADRAGDILREVGNLTFLRQETDAIRRQLAVDKQARQELEQLDRLLELEPQLATISSLSAIREPALPTSPVSPQRTRNIMLAGALGLMLGVFAALFLEFYRSTTPSLPARVE